jgi:chaperonin cofactor prefoldin
MFFTDKHKQSIAALHHTIEFLNMEIRRLTTRLEIQTTRLDALMKAYPNGVNKNGQPRKKIGRPLKKETA